MLGRLQSVSASLATKTNIWTAKTIYYGKVAAELSKQVYLKEGLQPPTVAQFKQVYCDLYKRALQLSKNPNSIFSYSQCLTKNNIVKFGAIGVQIAGFYTAGEAIGRRKLVGYKNYSTNVEHKH
ncbi:hypothetical protein TPHA_0D00930 [Tetrapisispora phaffii CBS 4417]|uniref:ATP synthase subunit g, mitochondrial n=1 Tax=Tetrapisispora phaffii (strain ATCC 24235 / CBS 4417 / NBRC 1672 / NRRL Y-8282 / UCD 70-5) TaxID=1071381 RepID=G8BSB3_TETPH|nr:hypothetical protein TPHA_0D00930 [Tetrapisispora phaffii CBS 4417]CCE62734.1 hypothetical protein TPHA_0D00930 [Tetrapisispora phaffii CBS 4417]